MIKIKLTSDRVMLDERTNIKGTNLLIESAELNKKYLEEKPGQVD